ncbi:MULTISPECIES: hypothetical protein [Winogradskyella]|uniref:hypothetical protein n=1 Tax=Winogradskyella TaxID=286104 RepID=UPI0015CDEFEC|nr:MULTISPECIES: hypothetical protein [Winogradskyella]QXP78805.1 hypothetical protein H0I32_16610 [Winogradskyella sp. HaHa_3_26]
MRKIIFLIFILQSSLTFSQIQQYFFVDDVEVVEYLYVKICIGENGETTSVTEIPERTTYKNKEVTQQIIDYRKGIDFLKGSKYSNKCFDYPFTIVNSKYQSLEMTNTDCVTNFGKGKYRYINPEYQDVKIKRRKRKQIEKTKDSKSVYKIEWISPCNYVLTYLKVSKPEYEYLIGQKIDVKIIDVLENENYVYYSNLSDRTYGFGEMKKL